MKSLSLFIHVYYPNSWKLICERCDHIFQQANNIIVTACHDDVIEEIKATEYNIVVLKVPNIGKDIGGKLGSLSYYLTCCQETEYLAFLHDKISPQTINAEYWFDKLYEIFKKKKFSRVMELFGRHKNIGIAGSKTFLKNEFIKQKKIFDTTNNNILQKLIKAFGLTCKAYNYIGGTIFIARSKIFNHFFSAHSPLQIRESLEPGNVLDLEHGTNTHSWERMFCLIAQAQGYKVVGV